jgi:predicted metal-dependent hydrolase
MKHPPSYYRYFELFNNEEFWESHEALEEIWRETDNDLFLRGMIVFAAAFVHVQRNNPSGCRKVLDKCILWLEPFAPRRWDLDVDRVLAHARFCRAELDRLPDGALLKDHIPMIKLTLLDETAENA